MTDLELDLLMQRVLLDSLKLDEARQTEGSLQVFEPSSRYKRQIRAMLANPKSWARKKLRPLWKKAIERAAIILLVISAILGSILAIHPAARAAVTRWITEWYETHVVYRYAGEPISQDMPRYELSALPEGYAEVESERIAEAPAYFRTVYKNERGERIVFSYVHMQQGAALAIQTEGYVVEPAVVNGYSAQLFRPEAPEGQDCIVTWSVPEVNLQFALYAQLDGSDILHIAESVYLYEMTKS